MNAPFALPKKRSFEVAIGKNGRMNLPAEVRRALGIAEAGKLLIYQDGDETVLTTTDRLIDEVQSHLQPRRAPDELVSDSLIADRRAEAKRERDGG